MYHSVNYDSGREKTGIVSHLVFYVAACPAIEYSLGVYTQLSLFMSCAKSLLSLRCRLPLFFICSFGSRFLILTNFINALSVSDLLLSKGDFLNYESISI